MPYDYSVDMTNRFKGLDQQTECLKNTVQETMTKTIPKRKKKCKKAKWLSEECLKIAEKRRKEKGMEERERYTQLQHRGPETSKET